MVVVVGTSDVVVVLVVEVVELDVVVVEDVVVEDVVLVVALQETMSIITPFSM